MIYRRNWETSLGFTLLELLITIAVMAAILLAAAPSFSSLTTASQMTRLADELLGFMNQAKSEAVFRNQDLWAHINVATIPDDSGTWSITLTDSDAPGSGTALLTMSGKPFTNIALEPVYSSEQVKFGGVRGKVKAGSMYFYPTEQTSKKLKLSTSYGASRILVCGVGGDVYGYPECD
ncbi:GspH/FimT family pseudopilin [Vibrio sp. SCSIO 43135]|uniref:GspH/FimT family pseudopilin n=1 Tax=Vibrio sp. SCSIO 43135 TaxID=2819096 RepID=UPI002074D027|nr:GspH/FimT family pseudopilin [Vibrio sp. SCSIO 43135]USD41770.1 GspH/FimT family pseudopilin [Vibrio sp. SCSIO 43135]